MFFAFGLGSLPGGLLSDRFDSRTIIFAFLLLTGTGAIATAFAPDFFTTMLAQLVVGLGGSLYHPAGVSLVSKLFKRSETGRAMGIHGVGGNIIQATAPGIAGVAFFLFGWSLAFIILAIPAFIFAFIFLIWIRTSPSEEYQVSSQKTRLSRKELLKTLTTRVILLYFIIEMLRGMYYNGVVAWLPEFFAARASSILLSPVLDAGVKTMIAFLPGVLGQIVGGMIADKRGRRVPLMVFCAGTGVVLITLPLISFDWLLLAVSTLFGFTYFAGQAIENAMGSDITDPRTRGSMFGVTFFFQFGVGSFAAGLGGLVIIFWGINWVLPVMAVIAFISVAITYLMPKDTPQETPIEQDLVLR
jgi:MFS family permease